MHYHIAICDDCDADRAYLQDLTRQWAETAEKSIDIDLYSSAESFLFSYPDKPDYDILLLDIEMGEMDGVTMAKTLRKDKDTVEIIFVTGYSDYIAEGYEVAALHYLVKPIKPEKLHAVLDRAAEKRAKNERVLCFEQSGETVRIPIYRIRYADVYGNYVTIHADTDVTVKMTLGELMEDLDNRFYRVGRSVIVNLTCVSRATRTELRLLDYTVIPIPRGAYDGLNRAIIDMR